MSIFERNLGIVTQAQQQRLAQSKVAVIGLGGLGGVIAEVLARSGVGRFLLVDHDRFEQSNINRQIYAFQDTLGAKKTEVTLEYLRRINPSVYAELADTLTDDNHPPLLGGCDAIVLAADDIVPCVIASRFARAERIPVIEGWAVPYANVRVFTPATPTLEEAYGFTDLPERMEELTAEMRSQMRQKMLFMLASFDGLADFYPEETQERIRGGFTPSFAPMVWMAAIRMALETVKVLLDWGDLALAPRFALYDPFRERIPAQKGSQ